MTVTGAALIAVVLGLTAWLMLRGGRAAGRGATGDEDTGPGLDQPPPPE